ncbi:hypothetical protein Tco_0779213 [Tanacetum coccineum]
MLNTQKCYHHDTTTKAAVVHPDDLCPSNKRYYLMDANKKVDLENVQCPLENKILMNIITNHPFDSALQHQHLKKQEQGWNENTTMDDYRRDEAYKAL